MYEVAQGFKQAALRYHPDTGDEPDVDLFETALIAYEILSDPAKRAYYDALPQGRFWMDRRMRHLTMRVTEKKIRDEASSIMEYEENMQIFSELLTAEAEVQQQEYEEKKVAHEQIEVVPDDYAYYYKSFEVDQSIVTAWLSALALAFWHRGMDTHVKVGFHDAPPAVEQYQWGVVIFVPPIEPIPMVATCLVDEAIRTGRLDLVAQPTVVKDIRVRKVPKLMGGVAVKTYVAEDGSRRIDEREFE
jgi:hypothetical protein